MATAMEASLEADNGNGIIPALNFPHIVDAEQSDLVVEVVVTTYWSSSLSVPATAAAKTKSVSIPFSLDSLWEI